MNAISRENIPSSAKLPRLALFLLCVPLLLLAMHSNNASGNAHAQGVVTASGNAIYLPMIQSRLNNDPQPAPSPSPTPAPPSPSPTPAPPSDANGALFMQAVEGKKIAGAQIKVDAQGGMHLAYYDAVPLDKNPGATYAYCPPPAEQCSDASKWTYLSGMGDKIDEVQLQLTPEGYPRLLIGYHATSHNLELYIYGECNTNCTSGESAWKFITAGRRSLSVINVGSTYQPKRSFALDPQGRPAFVVHDTDYNPEPDHAGGYYYSCQSDCTTEGSWTEVRFTPRRGGFNEDIYQPVLQFTSTGKPRIVAELYPLSGTGYNGIYYFVCDNDCNNEANWQRTLIDARTSGPLPSWDLALDRQDRPRVAYFKYNGRDYDRNLFYLWCNDACVKSGSWQSLNVGLPVDEGIGADLELDATGRPRMAYLTTGDLGYAWCNGDCASAQGWQHSYVDSDEQMTKDYPVPLPPTCQNGIWEGYAPSLALDKGGNPRMTYNASYKASCLFQDPTKPDPPRTEFIEVWHSVRTVFAPQP